ncbi:MAG: hypothetical protein ACK5JD_05430 [Mangrovibacterium sp.]
MKRLFQLLALFYAACWIASAIQAEVVPSVDLGSKSSINYQNQGEISYPQDLPAVFLHKVSGGEQTLVEYFRFLSDKNYENKLTQARKPSVFISEFSIQILHQWAAVPLFIKGRALRC